GAAGDGQIHVLLRVGIGVWAVALAAGAVTALAHFLEERLAGLDGLRIAGERGFLVRRRRRKRPAAGLRRGLLRARGKRGDEDQTGDRRKAPTRVHSQ